MNTRQPDTFILSNFEGPLDFLLHLIQKNEIDITEVSLQKISAQYLHKLEEFLKLPIDQGAEFIGNLASLVYFKSKMLLPKHEQSTTSDDEAFDSKFEIIHHLIEYCRFKDAAKELGEREQRQMAHYYRGQGFDDVPEIKKPLGIEHISLEDLASLFKQIIEKASTNKGTINEEIWSVSDQIQIIRKMVREAPSIGFESLFLENYCREQLIVLFLAILELMKLGEIHITKELSSGFVSITRP